MNDDLTMRAIAWRNGPDTGLSSIALMSYLMGWPNPGHGPDYTYRHPIDPDDFGRCYRVLKAFPELKVRLHDARAMSLEWRNLVDCWRELERLYEEESPSGRCPQLYEAMQFCIGRRCVECGERVIRVVRNEPGRCDKHREAA